MPSPAPVGTDPGFSACATSRRRRRGHESASVEAGSLRHLYPCLHRPGAGTGLQFSGCPIRCFTGLYPQPGPCRLDDGRSKYDDGGFSGGNTDRPALQRLLDDVRAGKVDVIVVYKVDRLTRSLADFAKLVELFDQHDVSFVSVTQQFNTTTSMGRLTLNVLLSFAQFEREVTSERIRDKIAASKRKGLWVGGMAPLGYDTKDRKITVNEAEAERVRDIFRSYLKLGSIGLLLADLRKRGRNNKGQDLKIGTASRRDSLHTRPPRPLAAQSLLHRPGGLQGRASSRRATRNHRSKAVRCRPGQA